MLRFLLIAMVTGMLCLSSTGFAQPAFDPSAGLDDWRREIEIQVTNLSSAYGLDADTQSTLRQEMEARLVQQADYDKSSMESMMKKVEAINAAGVAGDPDSPLNQELNAEMLSSVANAPLNEDQVVKWLETRIPQNQVTEGHQRYQELRELRLQKMVTEDQDLQRAPGLKVELGQALKDGTAELSPTEENPLPKGEKEERIYPQITERARNEGIVIPQSAAALDVISRPETKAELAEIEKKKAAAEAASPSHAKRAKLAEQQAVTAQPAAPEIRVQVDDASPKPAQQPMLRMSSAAPPVVRSEPPPSSPESKPAPLAPAPPLDEWEKYVQTLCKKYSLDDAQKTNAFSILKDLRRRANQYRMSRADLYAQAELKTDAKVRTEDLKNLNRPIDALFDELKLRLESLPTLEQRERAKNSK